MADVPLVKTAYGDNKLLKDTKMGNIGLPDRQRFLSGRR